MEDTTISSRKAETLDVIPPMTPVLFGPPSEPMKGHIHCVLIYQDHIRYQVGVWAAEGPATFELADTDFEVLPQTGPKPVRIGFLSREQA